MSKSRDLADLLADGTITADELDIGQIGGSRNRIINGAMRIDQRNAGASVTSQNGVNTFITDRWFVLAASPAVLTMQQDNDAPEGYFKSVKITVTTPDASLAASDFNSFRHIIEGLNVGDLKWGTANAQDITLSFWVRSSLTGSFTVGVRNNAVDRSYVDTYTISSADTWEYKTITIPGDTSGTWLNTNGIGIRIDWSLGMGSDFQGTAGSWTATNDVTTSGAVSVVGTSGATFYITGVQLEVGTVATPFEHRSYGEELALCQRYYYQFVKGNAQNIGIGGYYNNSLATTHITFPVTMRTAPTAIQTSGSDYYLIFSNNGTDTFDSFSSGIQQPTTTSTGFDVNTGVGGTSGYMGRFATNNASASIAFNAEL